MGENSNERDLMLQVSENAQAAIESEAMSIDVFSVREVINELDPKNLDRYSDSLLYQAYYAAKKCKTSSRTIIASKLNISTQLYDYYCEKYPKFATVVKMGVMDAREEMKETIVEALYKAAQGYTVQDTVTVTQNDYDSEGALVGTTEKISHADKYVQPNVSAGIELMKRLDPSWVPQVNLNVDGTLDHIHTAVQDVNVVVDYRKLSPQSIRELLSSQKLPKDTTGLNKSEEQPTQVQNDEIIPEEPVKRKRGRPKKITTIISQTKKERAKAKKDVNKSATNAVNKQIKRRAKKNE